MTDESRGPIEDPEEATLVEPEEPEEPEESAPLNRATSQEISQALSLGRDIEVADTSVIARSIAERILGAETADAVWEPTQPVGAREILETPIRIFGFEVLRSTMESGIGVYLVMDAVNLLSGEKLLVTCGATNVVAQLIRAAELEALPENLKFEARPSMSNPGRSVLWLRKVPAEQLP